MSEKYISLEMVFFIIHLHATAHVNLFTTLIEALYRMVMYHVLTAQYSKSKIQYTPEEYLLNIC